MIVDDKINLKFQAAILMRIAECEWSRLGFCFGRHKASDGRNSIHVRLVCQILILPGAVGVSNNAC